MSLTKKRPSARELNQLAENSVFSNTLPRQAESAHQPQMTQHELLTQPNNDQRP